MQRMALKQYNGFGLVNEKRPRRWVFTVAETHKTLHPSYFPLSSSAIYMLCEINESHTHTHSHTHAENSSESWRLFFGYWYMVNIVKWSNLYLHKYRWTLLLSVSKSILCVFLALLLTPLSSIWFHLLYCLLVFLNETRAAEWPFYEL